MAKIQLGKRPETFAPILVKFPMPDGTEGVINAVFKYRTRTEYGAFQDSVYAPAAAASPATPGEADQPVGEAPAVVPAAGSTLNSVQTGIRDRLAGHLNDILQGWDLDVPLSADSLKTLADELPGACQALFDAYGAACTHGRLGN